MADALHNVPAKVLLVEDNELNREMLTRRLVRKGFEVVVAVDGLQGVAMAGSVRPDLILMDMSLPGIDGWEATRLLKADTATRALPVIALTAHAMADDREKALAAGCDDFDTKPVDLERLLGKMRALLALKAAWPAAEKPWTDVATVLTLPAVAASLPALQEALDALCSRCGATADVRADLQVVLDEVCTNIFKHAYAGLKLGMEPGTEPGWVRLSLRHHAAQTDAPAAISLSFGDAGQPFNPLLQPAPDVSLPADERPIGGLGIHLVRQLTNRQTYRRTLEGGNQLTVVKHLA